MTLEEKVMQLQGTWQNPPFIKDERAHFVDSKGNFLADKAGFLLKNGLGEMTRPSENRGPREMADFTNTVQKWMKDNTRLGIPILFHDECLHGHVAPKGTSYPQAIALAAHLGHGAACMRSSPPPRRKSALAVRSSAWRRSSTWPAIRAGAGRKRPTAKILT